MPTRKEDNVYSKLNSKDLAMIELAKQPEVVKLGIQNYKKVVGVFGVVSDKGEDLLVSWVQSSLAKKVPPQQPFSHSEWSNYQFDTMFAGW